MFLLLKDKVVFSEKPQLKIINFKQWYLIHSSSGKLLKIPWWNRHAVIMEVTSNYDFSTLSLVRPFGFLCVKIESILKFQIWMCVFNLLNIFRTGSSMSELESMSPHPSSQNPRPDTLDTLDSFNDADVDDYSTQVRSLILSLSAYIFFRSYIK